MKKQFYTMVAIGVIFLSACKMRRGIQHPEDGPASAAASKLVVRLTRNSPVNTPDSVGVVFTVINPTNGPVRFCKWETAFEPRLGKYFEVTDADGHEVAFKGAMARRVMPPPAEAYINVGPHDSVKTVINLARTYVIVPGKYRLKYVGGGVSGLPNGSVTDFSVAGSK